MNKRLQLFLVFLQLFLPVTAQGGGGGSVVGVIVGAIGAILILVALAMLGFCCYKRRKHLKESNEDQGQNQVGTTPSQTGTRGPYNSVPPPSYSRKESQNIFSNGSNSNKYASTDLPPPYSSSVKIFHTQISGQSAIPRKFLQGTENLGFMNKSFSSFSEFPSMTDILLTSSRTSLPAAATLESCDGKKSNKFSDSARGDSIESKIFSQGTPLVYDNLRFSLSFEEEHRDPKNVLNECFESYTDSESETVPTSSILTGNWLDPIKNQVKSECNASKCQSPDKRHQGTSHNDVRTKRKSAPKVKRSSRLPQDDRGEGPPNQNLQHLYKQNSCRTKRRRKCNISSTEVLNDVSIVPGGSVSVMGARIGCSENRLSKISSDSGLGELSSSTLKSTTSKNNPKLKWVAAENIPHQQSNRSTSTEV